MRQASGLARTCAGWSYLAAGLLLTTAPAAGQAPASCYRSRYQKNKLPHLRTKKLSCEYQRVRQADCMGCSSWEESNECALQRNGDRHRLMEELETRLRGRPLAVVRRVMGHPDEVRRDSMTVYYYNGRHDYLYFYPTQAGTTVSHWYHALE